MKRARKNESPAVTAAKVGGKFVPGAGEVLIALDVVPEVRDIARRRIKGTKAILKKAGNRDWRGTAVEAGRQSWGSEKDAARLALAVALSHDAAETLIRNPRLSREEKEELTKLAVFGSEVAQEQGKVISASQQRLAAALKGKKKIRGLLSAAGSGIADTLRVQGRMGMKAFQTFANPAHPLAVQLLPHMISLRVGYQYGHWNATSYPDHLLFERLYKSLDEDIDTLAELAVQESGKIQPSNMVCASFLATEELIIHTALEALKTGPSNRALRTS